MSEEKVLTANDLELCQYGDSVPSISLREVREEVEQDHIKKVLVKCNWNISKAALELGVSRPTLHDLMKKYQISKDLEA